MIVTDSDRREAAQRIRDCTPIAPYFAYIRSMLGLHRSFPIEIVKERLASLVDPECEEGYFDRGTVRPVDWRSLLGLAGELEKRAERARALSWSNSEYAAVAQAHAGELAEIARRIQLAVREPGEGTGKRAAEGPGCDRVALLGLADELEEDARACDDWRSIPISAVGECEAEVARRIRRFCGADRDG